MTTPQIGVSSIHPTRPFMTVPMWKARPTGLTTDDLRVRGGPQQQDEMLAQIILEASAEMNSYVYGRSNGVLHATTDVETLRSRLDRWGNFKITPRFLHVLAVTDFKWGNDIASMSDLGDLSHIEIEPERIVVPSGSASLTTSAGPLQFGPPLRTDYPWRLILTYVNGYALTSLAASVAAGASSVTVGDATGIYAGVTQVTINDPVGGIESFTPSAVNGNVLTVPALQYSHDTGSYPIQVDALHEDLITACAEMTSGFVKRRAQTAVSGAATARKANAASPGEDNFARAIDLLESFIPGGRSHSQ